MAQNAIDMLAQVKTAETPKEGIPEVEGQLVINPETNTVDIRGLSLDMLAHLAAVGNPYTDKEGKARVSHSFKLVAAGTINGVKLEISSTRGGMPTIKATRVG
jgi:hypothetical protein